ncbi:hypothetical protein MycrhDRAFT_1580 [Mycolicibacterium rhodesiae JS60]|nr:hypothetical protein MycrhDRAFT_1580 [Mycolicibacterium rhodesiae JS60]
MTTQRSVMPALPFFRGHAAPNRRAQLGTCLTATALTIASVSMAAPARAGTADNLRAAVMATRATVCNPLRSDAVADQVAEKVNNTTDVWINNASRAVPETDALPLLKDLGYAGSKSTILSGAAKSDSDSIKALLLQGFAKIQDCTYTDFGVSALYNAKKDLILTTVVLAA